MASGQEHGIFRLKFADKGERRVSQPVDFHTSRISGGALAAPTGATLDAIPNNPPVRVGGGRVIAEFISGATDIVESEESNWEIDVLVVDSRGNVLGATTLLMEQFTGFTAAGTVDITATVNVPARLAYIDAPEGQAYMLNPRGKTRAYIGDDA